jgi:hypothetical protein
MVKLTIQINWGMVNMTIMQEVDQMVEPEPTDFLPKRVPGLQSRAEFLVLTGLELEAFNSLRRRGQLPVPPLGSPTQNIAPTGVPSGETFGVPDLVFTDRIPACRLAPEEWQDAHGWSPWAALALIAALALADRYQLSRTRAAEIARNVVVATRHWRDICATSRQVVEGREPERDILLASLDRPDIRPTKTMPDPTADVGTLEELAARYPTATGLIAVSVTRCAAQMRERAEKAGIDILNFWID